MVVRRSGRERAFDCSAINFSQCQTFAREAEVAVRLLRIEGRINRRVNVRQPSADFKIIESSVRRGRALEYIRDIIGQERRVR